MGKIARIISIEWDTKEDNIECMAKFRSIINELAVGIELSLVANTDKASAMAIQVWPDEATAHAYDERMEAWSEQNFEASIRDRIRFEGDVDFWFQQIKYFGSDAINIRGAGA